MQSCRFGKNTSRFVILLELGFSKLTGSPCLTLGNSVDAWARQELTYAQIEQIIRKVTNEGARATSHTHCNILPEVDKFPSKRWSETRILLFSGGLFSSQEPQHMTGILLFWTG